MKIWIYIIWNILVFALYGIDKYRAVKGEWRISEKTLLAAALLMGGAGALVGMQVFRHKTNNKLFQIVVPICLVINIVLLFGTSV